MKEKIREIAGSAIVGFACSKSPAWTRSATVLGAGGDVKLDVPSKKIASYLEEEGFRTKIVDRYESGIDIRSLAISASLGFLGKNGLVVTPKFGPRARFSVVLSDAQIKPDKKDGFDFCNGCNKCIESCPCGALTEKFNISACAELNKDERCLRCIEVCPVGK